MTPRETGEPTPRMPVPKGWIVLRLLPGEQAKFEAEARALLHAPRRGRGMSGRVDNADLFAALPEGR